MIMHMGPSKQEQEIYDLLERYAGGGMKGYHLVSKILSQGDRDEMDILDVRDEIDRELGRPLQIRQPASPNIIQKILGFCGPK